MSTIDLQSDERSALLSEPDFAPDATLQDICAQMDALLVEHQDATAPSVSIASHMDAMVGRSFTGKDKLHAMLDKYVTSDDNGSGEGDDDAIADRVADMYDRSYTNSSDYGVPFDAAKASSPKDFEGILSLLTRKGRDKKSEEKKRLKVAKLKEQVAIAEENRDKKKEKNADRYKAVALPGLEKNPAFAAKPRTMPTSTREKIVVAGVEKQTKRQNAVNPNGIQPLPGDPTKTMKLKYSSMSVAEKRLATFASDFVRLAPGKSLRAVTDNFAALHDNAGARHFLGSLALGAAVGKLRSNVEANAGFSGKQLRTVMEESRAQAKVPMSTSESAVFADAIGGYLADVRARAVKVSDDPEIQEEEAIRIGEQFADHLTEKIGTVNGVYNANHPEVVATAVADHLFRATYKSAMRDQDFVDKHVNSFWASPVTFSTWKKHAHEHFA